MKLWLQRAVLITLAATGGSLVAYADEVPSPLRQRELVHLVRQDCGSCHGLTLQGGLGSPLLPAALHDKPRESLVATILQGRSGTAMPGWARFMTPGEAEWIVDQLQRGFPQEH